MQLKLKFNGDKLDKDPLSQVISECNWTDNYEIAPQIGQERDSRSCENNVKKRIL